MKLLIVDDEAIEREGLQAILRKGFPELVIEQARNGRAAVQMNEEFAPDVILMDIRMPGMNGLEAVEQINATHPEVKFIMVTAYDTFDYARQAIKLGVKDYLLKPSKASEITATVGKVLKEIEEERRQSAVSREQQSALEKALPLVETDIVTQLLFDHVHEVHLDELVELLGTQLHGEMFVLLILMPPGTERLYSSLKEKVRASGSGWVGPLNGRQLPVIVFRDTVQSYRSQASVLARTILSAAGPAADGWFIGVGGVYRSLEQVRQSYQEALIASMDAAIPVKYRFYDDLTVTDSAVSSQQARQRERLYLEQLRLGQWEQARGSLMELIERFEKEGAELLAAQQRVLEGLWLASRVLNEMGIEAEAPLFAYQAESYKQLRAETTLLLERLRQLHAERSKQLAPDTIQQVRSYILQHSHEDLSLEEMAKQAGLSPFYLSKMFKEQLGVNYIDFLTECRIDKAKKLMSDPNKSLKEITFEVGYHDPNYFSKVFRKLCDVSPTEYRKMLLGLKADDKGAGL